MPDKDKALAALDAAAAHDAGLELRRKAEVALQEATARLSQSPAALTPTAIQQTLHELQVHQIELEMQNEELRRGQLQLDAERARFFDLYDLAPVSYFSLNQGGLIVQANLAAASLLGVARRELLKMHFSSFIVLASQDTYYRLRKKLLASDETQTTELQMTRKDGTPFWAELTASVAKDTEDRPELHFVLSDISERKQHEQVLRDREKRFRGLIEQSLTGIYIVQDGLFSYANPRLEEMLGYGHGALIGIRFMDLVLADDGPVVQAADQALRSGASSSAYSVRVRRRDASVIEIEVQGTRYTMQGDTATIGMAQDVTEKKRAEADIQRYLDELKAAFMGAVEVATSLTELRDPYTAGHERRVGKLAAAIGTELGFDAQRTEGLLVSGYLHDIGKITIPTEILSKPGKISSIEYQMIQSHAQAGYDVLKRVKFPWPVAQMALQHHERIDGSGYPQGLKGDAILLDACIIAVADVVEAMASHRPYRPTLGIEAALAEIEQGSGKRYDAAVAQACLKLFREQGYTLPA
jgi:PAS domain S-box-containing protein